MGMELVLTFNSPALETTTPTVSVLSPTPHGGGSGGGATLTFLNLFKHSIHSSKTKQKNPKNPIVSFYMHHLSVYVIFNDY